MLCLLVWGCIFCCHSALGNMQGAENWFTGRDLDFSITQHTCCQVGRAGNNPHWLTYPRKTRRCLPSTPRQKTFARSRLWLVLSNIRARWQGSCSLPPCCILYFCDVYQQMGRWPALLTEPEVRRDRNGASGADGMETDERRMRQRCVFNI